VTELTEMEESTLESLLTRARQHLESGAWNDALETAEKAIELSEGNIRAWRYKGVALLELERHKDASEAFTNVTQLKPDDLYGWRRLSNVFEELKDYQEAIETCRRAIKACSGHPYIHHDMGNLYWKQGDYRSAWEQWKVALKAYSDGSPGDNSKQDADYFYSLGRLRQDFGSLHEAEKCFEEGLKREANHVGILKAIVNLYVECSSETDDDQLQINYHWKARRRYREAVKALSERLKARENAVDIVRLGELHLAVGDHKEARDCLQKALALEPENPFALVDLGVICTRMTRPDYEKAAECFQQAISLDPFDLKAQSNLAEVYHKMNLIEAAEEQYQRVLRVGPEQVESHIGLAEVYAALGDDGEEDMYEGALLHFGKALTLGQPGCGSKRLAKKERAAVLYSRGYVLVKAYEAGKPRREHLRRARDDFRECTKLDRDHHAARRAQDRVKQELTSTEQWLPDRVGPLLVSVAALLVFVFVQLAFFVGWPTVDLGQSQYVLLQSFAVVGECGGSLLQL
jgi:tetratricopeptide (TPR) repeat protein